MDENLHALAYYSRNAIAGDGEMLLAEIASILDVARANNRRNDITGALLYTGGRFAQVLEGPLAKVEAIFEQIQTDPRHYDVHVLQFGPVAQRCFAQWNMAFAGLAAGDPEHALIAELLARPQDIVANPEGRDFISILSDLIHRQELHHV